jgi:hypothetical protein
MKKLRLLVSLMTRRGSKVVFVEMHMHPSHLSVFYDSPAWSIAGIFNHSWLHSRSPLSMQAPGKQASRCLQTVFIVRKWPQLNSVNDLETY